LYAASASAAPESAGASHGQRGAKDGARRPRNRQAATAAMLKTSDCSQKAYAKPTESTKKPTANSAAVASSLWRRRYAVPIHTMPMTSRRLSSTMPLAPIARTKGAAARG
jgi:hypothetical protein